MNHQLILLYGLLIFAAALVGGLLPLWVPQRRENHLKVFVCFGAGLLLGMAFLHMIPEASHLVPETFGTWFLAGFLILLILERFAMVHACEEHGCNYHRVGLAAFLGLTVHGVIEGFALASSLLLQDLAPLILLAILAHKAPAGFALTSILRLAGKTKKQILLFATGVALSGPLGLGLAYGFLQSEGISNAAGALIAMSAGTFLYIGACDLLPELHKKDHDKFWKLAAFGAGILISYLSTLFLHHPHSH